MIKQEAHVCRCTSCNSLSCSCCAIVSLITSFSEHGGAVQHPPHATGFICGTRSGFAVVSMFRGTVHSEYSDTLKNTGKIMHKILEFTGHLHCNYQNNHQENVLKLTLPCHAALEWKHSDTAIKHNNNLIMLHCYFYTSVYSTLTMKISKLTVTVIFVPNAPKLELW